MAKGQRVGAIPSVPGVPLMLRRVAYTTVEIDGGGEDVVAENLAPSGGALLLAMIM